MPLWALLSGHFFVFFLAALMCHMVLVSLRPSGQRSTEFYVWMSLGGVLGGLFNALRRAAGLQESHGVSAGADLGLLPDSALGAEAEIRECGPRPRRADPARALRRDDLAAKDSVRRQVLDHGRRQTRRLDRRQSQPRPRNVVGPDRARLAGAGRLLLVRSAAAVRPKRARLLGRRDHRLRESPTHCPARRPQLLRAALRPQRSHAARFHPPSDRSGEQCETGRDRVEGPRLADRPICPHLERRRQRRHQSPPDFGA